MVNGIGISESDFLDLPIKKQNAVLFQNVQEIKVLVGGWRFRQKLVISWLSGLTAIGSYLAVKLIELIK